MSSANIFSCQQKWTELLNQYGDVLIYATFPFCPAMNKIFTDLIHYTSYFSLKTTNTALSKKHNFPFMVM